MIITMYHCTVCRASPVDPACESIRTVISISYPRKQKYRVGKHLARVTSDSVGPSKCSKPLWHVVLVN